ncbi:MAG TPA: Gfo/Idh/MocA family oxidoreductase [Candidatus Elarobacter sp.]|jgi:predicted dehydrogenase
MVTIGLIGCGRWGRNILRDLRALGARVAVAEHRAENAAAARAGGAAVVVDSASALPRVDAFVVATPTSTHADVVLQLAATGLPVFCEKPLADDERAAERIAELAGDRLFVMDKWRYHPGVLALAAIARSGELGPVQGVVTRRLGWGNPHVDVDVAWILLPHDLSIALEILGELPVPLAATAEWDDDGLLSLEGVLRGAAWHRFEVGARSPQPIRSVEVRCRDGVATLDGAYEDAVRIQRTVGALRGAAAGASERRAFVPAMPLLAELRAFLAFVAGDGPPPKSSAADGARIVRAVAELRALAGAPVAA